MASIATVKPKVDSASTRAGETAQFSFVVSNTTGKRLTVGAEVLPEDPATKSWFRISGDSQREFGPDDLDQYDLEVALPGDVAPGTYNFRLLVFSTDAPGEDYEEGPTVAVEVVAPDTPTVPKPKKDKKFPWWIVAVAGAAVVLIIVGVVLYFVLSGTEVPDVKGMELDEAIVEIENAGLSVPENGVSEEFTGEMSPGLVIKQTPGAGEPAPEDGAVTLTIEQLTVAVPSVIGMKVPAARTRLSEAQLKMAPDIEYQRSEEFPGGAIISQDPAPDARSIPGQEVAVTVAQELIGVPDLKGKNYTDARVALETLGLSVGKVGYRKTGGAPNTVVNQDPASGTEVNAASKVDLTLVEKKIRVPDVKGKTVNEAKTILSRAGLEPALFPIAPPASQKVTAGSTPKVHDQKPHARSSVYTGTEVTLVYYRVPVRVFTPNRPQVMKLESKLFKQIQDKRIRLRSIEGDTRAIGPAED